MKKLKLRMIYLVIIITPLLFLVDCNKKNGSIENLRESLTFYASFDKGFKADFARGDSGLYTAPTWDRRSELQLFEGNEDFLQIREEEGINGNALWVDCENSPIFFYRGAENIVYDKEDWSGTVSFWLRLTPEEDLRDGYSDPIQITSRGWNDGALFVDFTEENPRTFRFAIFPDREIWDPKKRPWEEISVEERPMVDVSDHPFSKEEWTHVAFGFSNFNTGRMDGRVDSYLNGEYVGSLSDREKTFTWDPERVAIWIGYNYRGYFDELAIFDRKLGEEEISQLYSHRGIQEIINHQ